MIIIPSRINDNNIDSLPMLTGAKTYYQIYISYPIAILPIFVFSKVDVIAVVGI